MITLGTVLPTRASLAIGDRVYEAEQRQKAKVARALGLTGETRTPCGEVRYYRSATQYAVITRRMVPAWFETRADGDYSIKG